jgi:PhnB protein
MQMNPYLSFKGDCEAAFKFYAECLGGKLGDVFRYGGSPAAEHAPPDWGPKVMHATLTIGDQILMGADITPDRYEQPRGFSLSIQTDDVVKGETIFERLAEGGTVTMPFEKTFWAARFGMLVDRFGIPWMVNCEGPEERPA